VKTVIVVDEDPDVCAAMMLAIEGAGFNVWVTGSWGDLPSLLQRLDPGVLVVAEHLAGLSGRHIVGTTTKHWPDVETIVLTDDPDLAGAAYRLGSKVAPRTNPRAVVAILQNMLIS
jgi:DNA-binding NtrC family response regulator